MAANGNPLRSSLLALSFTLLCFGTGRGAAAADPRETLGALVPADVQIYVRWKRTPAQAALMAPFEDAWEKLVRSDVHWDIFDLATSELTEGQREEVRGVVKRVLSMLGKVPWGGLIEKEFAMGTRLRIPIPEYILLFRASEGASGAERLRDGLRGLLQEVSGMVGEPLTFSDSEEEGVKVSELALQGGLIGIDVAAFGDVVALSTSREVLRNSIALHAGKRSDGSAGAIIDSSRFREAIRNLGEDRDTESFFDIAKYLEIYKGILGMQKLAIGENPHAKAAFDLVDLLFGELQRMETLVSAQRTVGNRIHGSGCLSLRKGFEEGLFQPVLGNRPPLERLERTIPADATCFYFSNGIDWAALYDLVERLVRERIPGGPGLLEQWEQLQGSINFHPRRELFGWIEGTWGWMVLPPDPGGSPSCEWAMMVRVSDVEAARNFLRRCFRAAAGYLTRRGQPIALETKEGLPEGLRVLRIDAFPDFHPVVGLHERIGIIASSPGAVERIAAVVRGEAPNITESPAIRSLGARIETPPSSVSYADVRGRLRNAAQLLTGAGFVISLLPREHDSIPIQKLGSILSKIGTFVREIDIAEYSLAWSNFDRERGCLEFHSAASFRVVREMDF